MIIKCNFLYLKMSLRGLLSFDCAKTKGRCILLDDFLPKGGTFCPVTLSPSPFSNEAKLIKCCYLWYRALMLIRTLTDVLFVNVLTTNSGEAELELWRLQYIGLWIGADPIQKPAPSLVEEIDTWELRMWNSHFWQFLFLADRCASYKNYSIFPSRFGANLMGWTTMV